MSWKIRTDALVTATCLRNPKTVRKQIKSQELSISRLKMLLFCVQRGK